MIGFKPYFSYEERNTRFSDRLRANVPIDAVLQMDRMEAHQLKRWNGNDGKLYAAVYFVRPNMRYVGGKYVEPKTGATHYSPAGPYMYTADQVLFVDVIDVERPQRDQISECWENFKKAHPLLWQSMEDGRVIINLQFER